MSTAGKYVLVYRERYPHKEDTLSVLSERVFAHRQSLHRVNVKMSGIFIVNMLWFTNSALGVCRQLGNCGRAMLGIFAEVVVNGGGLLRQVLSRRIHIGLMFLLGFFGECFVKCFTLSAFRIRLLI